MATSAMPMTTTVKLTMTVNTYLPSDQTAWTYSVCEFPSRPERSSYTFVKQPAYSFLRPPIGEGGHRRVQAQ